MCHFKLFRIAKLHITTPPFDLAVERFHLALELGIGTWRRGDLIHSGQEFSLLLKSFRLVFSTTQSHVYHSLDPVCGLKWAETRDIGRFAMWKQQVNLLLEKDYTLVLMTWRFFFMVRENFSAENDSQNNDNLPQSWSWACFPQTSFCYKRLPCLRRWLEEVSILNKILIVI